MNKQAIKPWKIQVTLTNFNQPPLPFPPKVLKILVFEKCLSDFDKISVTVMNNTFLMELFPNK